MRRLFTALSSDDTPMVRRAAAKSLAVRLISSFILFILFTIPYLGLHQNPHQRPNLI